MSALPPQVTPSRHASEEVREQLNSVFVQSDIQSLHAHMTACGSRQGWAEPLACWAETIRAFLLPRLVLSVTCAVLLGLVLGGICSLLSRSL